MVIEMMKGDGVGGLELNPCPATSAAAAAFSLACGKRLSGGEEKKRRKRKKMKGKWKNLKEMKRNSKKL